MASPFVSCEDALPALGVFNFYAAMTSIPLLAVPLYSLWLAAQLRVKRRARVVHAALLMFLVSLTGLFCTNLYQHVFGGLWAFRLHEMMAAVQALWNTCMLNALRRQMGHGWAVDEFVGFAIAAAATVAVISAGQLRPAWQEPVCGTVALLTVPMILGSTGYLSWMDSRAWWLFKRSLTGLMLVQLVVGVEPHLCAFAGSVYYHAVVDHACIWLFLGGVALNAVHLVCILTEQSPDA
mmetsp:Transcript_40588/g.100284  ORF Transcript_40588/g.100284 Transcript_40588/m.100284 type:complete len:237 (-) Transcript_40588:36-746(-)|eukprot:CAMPEP_0179838172 /NCGR_PEP_ID=MMETSP0982-20121206/511_1 /TAXON_ID=483367 /ORGANISM="non described non described, Strain CCMP 2436" /LENGTH=236 /DNA_ID=CAMNT_0021721479 /DNA_START=78 /DNA_END=788 /DNA_ORIENTATION=-